LKRDWLIISVLVLAFLLMAEAAGAPIMPALLSIFAGWLRTVPRPTAEWATMISAWAWPTMILLIVLLFRRPLWIAASHLARRFRADRIKAGIFEIDAATSLIPLNERDRDTEIKEGLWEFAGASDANWDQLLGWISKQIASSVEIEDFLSEGIFASERELAYSDLVEGR
jgi:hypothetical protein